MIETYCDYCKKLAKKSGMARIDGTKVYMNKNGDTVYDGDKDMCHDCIDRVRNVIMKELDAIIKEARI